MQEIEKLKDGYREFKEHGYEAEHTLWKELAEGQSPKFLVVACADSRSDPAMVFNTKPGELFVVRNVANLVPEYEPDEHKHGVSSALEFAVKALKVKHILVMGHRQCGGVHACATNSVQDTEFLGNWLKTLEPALPAAKTKAGDGASSEDLCNSLELEGIGQSLKNLMTFPFVRKAVEAGELHLHGARFGIADGKLEWRDENGTFTDVA